MTTSPPDQRGLRVLSLDGGGVRGLSTLYILDQLMYRMRPESDPKKRVKPCEIFDVIVGTSTGGLIAIMLGRLEMDVQSCIEAYQELSKDIFTPRRRTWVGGSLLHKFLGSATFSAHKLEHGVKKIIRDSETAAVPADGAQDGVDGPAGHENDARPQRNKKREEIPMLAESMQRCKVFVCTTLENGRAYRIRSYQSKYDPGLPFTVWQAARATSAAPTFFDPLKIGNIATLRDGGLRHNNPINEVVDEIRSEFGGREIACLVSIGTGVSKTEFFGNGLVSVAKACGRIATDTEQSERTFRQTHALPSQPLHDAYFRLEVEQGLQDTGMEEWKNMKRIWAVTSSYLDDPVRRDMLGKCATKLGGAEIGPDQPPQDPRLIEVIIRHHEFLGFQSSDDFVGRGVDLSWMENRLRPKDNAGNSRCPSRSQDDLSNRKPVVVALTGLGGGGKTQLMLRYCETHVDDYSAIFWFDARSEKTILESFKGIARFLNIGSSSRMKLDESQQSSALIRATEVDDVYGFKMWIRSRRRPWLLVFDNLVDILLVNQISKFFPTGTLSPGSIVITSRRRLNHQGWQPREIASLDQDSARQLLFMHARIAEPSPTQTAQADRIAQELGFFPLSLSLAGSYIQVVGTMDRYLTHYDKRKRELLKKALGKSLLDAYPISVFITWQTSLSLLPKSATRFFSLFCTLDRTNISVDLLRRACSPKQCWSPEGELLMVTPSDNGVPDWFLQLCFSDSGEWDELAILEDIFRLESLFFLQRESLEGSWIYEGQVVKEFSGGSDSLIIRMEPFVQEIGRLILDDGELQEYAAAAICIVVHSLEDDVRKSLRLKQESSKVEDNFVAILPTGGMSNSVPKLMVTLEECYGHIVSAAECYAKLDQVLKDNSVRILGQMTNYSKPTRCWFILAGMHLGGQGVKAACEDEESLGSALTFGALILENYETVHLHNHDNMAYWAAAGRICRLCEWFLWTKQCWIDGTKIAVQRGRALDSLSLRSAGPASFAVSFPLVFAAIMEEKVAIGLKMNPFRVDNSRFEGVFSAHLYLGIYTKLIHGVVERYFQKPRGRENSDLITTTAGTQAFFGLTWITSIHVDNRPGIEVCDATDLAKTGTGDRHQYMLPIPSVPISRLMEKFEKSTLYQHVRFGMAIVTAHWVRMPVREFLPYTKV